MRVLVDGLVQGVGYRWWTTRTAQGLGLRGWVRNLHDGRVEILASGPETALTALTEACHRGPPSAAVDDVAIEARPDADLPRGFDQRPTAEAPLA